MTRDDFRECEGCAGRITCWLNNRCDSAKVEAPTPAADAQDSSYRAEIEVLTSKLAVLSKIARDAEKANAVLRNELNAKHQQVPEIEAQVTALEAQLRDAGAENDRLRAEAAKPFKLEDNEQYRLQMAAICTAALGYWREGDSIHPDYDTPGLRDVAIRYDAYDKLYKERDRLTDELCRANDSLIAAHEQIADLTHRVTVSANHCAALIAEKQEAAEDSARALRQYTTTRQFHQQQAEVGSPNTARYRWLADRVLACDYGDNNTGGQQIGWCIRNDLLPKSGSHQPVFMYGASIDAAIDQQMRTPSRGVSIPVAELAVTEEEGEAFAAIPARTSAEIRLDDIEQRMERTENAFLVLQGRVNTHNDRLDALKDI